MVHHTRRADFGILGFGRFGRLAARHLREHGEVRAWDRAWERAFDGSHRGTATRSASPGPEAPEEFAAPLEEVCRARTVVYAVPIGALRASLQQTVPLLAPDTLVADTASVKVWPCKWLLEALAADQEVVGTHPLFGPDSAAEGLAGHRIAVVPLRTGRMVAIARFLEGLGLEVIETTADAHDRAMARTQSVVHWIGRALEATGAGPEPIDTHGYRRLLEILGYVTRDTWELFHDLQRWNPHAPAAREELLRALSDLHRASADLHQAPLDLHRTPLDPATSPPPDSAGPRTPTGSDGR